METNKLVALLSLFSEDFFTNYITALKTVYRSGPNLISFSTNKTLTVNCVIRSKHDLSIREECLNENSNRFCYI